MKTGSHAGGWHPSSKYMAITWKSFSNRSPRAFGVRSRTCGPGDCTRHCQHRTPRHRPRVAVRRHRIWPWSVRLCATQHVLIEAPVKLREACGNALCKLDLLGLVISAARICRVLRGEARLAEALQVAQHVVLRFAYFSVALAFLPQTEQRIAVRRARATAHRVSRSIGCRTAWCVRRIVCLRVLVFCTTYNALLRRERRAIVGRAPLHT